MYSMLFSRPTRQCNIRPQNKFRLDASTVSHQPGAQSECNHNHLCPIQLCQMPVLVQKYILCQQPLESHKKEQLSHLATPHRSFTQGPPSYVAVPCTRTTPFVHLSTPLLTGSLTHSLNPSHVVLPDLPPVLQACVPQPFCHTASSA